jgi:hypothetical protein
MNDLELLNKLPFEVLLIEFLSAWTNVPCTLTLEGKP